MHASLQQPHSHIGPPSPHIRTHIHACTVCPLARALWLSCAQDQSDQDQERLKEEAMQQVKVQSFQMKRSLVCLSWPPCSASTTPSTPALATKSLVTVRLVHRLVLLSAPARRCGRAPAPRHACVCTRHHADDTTPTLSSYTTPPSGQLNAPVCVCVCVCVGCGAAPSPLITMSLMSVSSRHSRTHPRHVRVVWALRRSSSSTTIILRTRPSMTRVLCT
jgi:hypothetical protein